MVYGCSATWGEDHQSGVENDGTEDVCADGYHICGDNSDRSMDDYSLIWQLTPDKCMTENIEQNIFYAVY